MDNPTTNLIMSYDNDEVKRIIASKLLVSFLNGGEWVNSYLLITSIFNIYYND